MWVYTSEITSEIDSTLLLFFVSKSLSGYVIMISCQKHLELPVVLYLLTELF